MDKQVMLTFETLTCKNLVFFMKNVSLCGEKSQNLCKF